MGTCRFDFCEPGSDSKDKDPEENLGQVLMGERLRASRYKVRDNSWDEMVRNLLPEIGDCLWKEVVFLCIVPPLK